MRKIIIISMMCGFFSIINAQSYVPITIVPATKTTINSSNGVIVRNLSVNDDKSVTVVFYNANYDLENDYTSYCFTWYLSYKNKRVSDYYTDVVRCRKEISHSGARFWPKSVPEGYEKYITVQFGREKQPKNRRDDD